MLKKDLQKNDENFNISLDYIINNTDRYFSNSKKIIEIAGDKTVVYAIFVRKPCIYACDLALNWLKEVANNLDFTVNIYENFKTGDKVAAGDPLFYIEGSFSNLVELETILLQKVGAACLCAWHSYTMSKDLKDAEFIAMSARHCVGAAMVELLDYGVSVGSKVAQSEGAKGFIGCSTQNNAHYFNITEALGTMPHALVGYAGSTLKATEMYLDIVNSKQVTVLVDYFGKELSDTLEVCNHFKDLAESGAISIRLDTHGGRYLEGLDNDKSCQLIEKYYPQGFHSYKEQEEITHLVGTGVSAAAIFYMREKLDENGFEKVKIAVSSGFNFKKCSLMAKVKAPIDLVGTGSFIPEKWSDTYATADIISYDGELSVKSGREYLYKKWKKQQAKATKRLISNK